MQAVALVLLLVGALLAATGSIIFLVGAIALLRSRGRQPWSQRFDGFTRRQVETARQAVYTGTLPADSSLTPLALTLAEGFARFQPVVLRAFPLIVGGIALGLAGSSLSGSGPLPVAVAATAAILFVVVGVVLFTVNLRYLRNAVRLLASTPAP